MIELNEPMDENKKVYLDVIEKQLNVTQNPIVSKITKHSKPLRKIKFRGKRLIDGTWIYGGFLKTQRTNKYQVGGTSRYNTIIPETLGQYVGLHDKNGREIYEGDIVEFDEKKWGCKYYEKVKWDYELLDLRKSDYKQWCVVVGNIYDNPELVGG